MGGENWKFTELLSGAVLTFLLLIIVDFILRSINPTSDISPNSHAFLIQVDWRFIRLYLSLSVLIVLVVRIVLISLSKIGNKVGGRLRTHLLITDDGSTNQNTTIYFVSGNNRTPIRDLLKSKEKFTRGDCSIDQALDLEAILATNSIHSIVLCLPMHHRRVDTILQTCKIWGIEVHWVLDNLTNRVQLYRVQNHSDTRLLIPGTPLSNSDILLKRITDIVLSIIAILLLSPIFLFVILSIKLGDRGPVFFKQARVGLNRRHFNMYKFRSMCLDAEAKQKELMHLNEMSYPVFKIKNDPRVTRFGRFLRRTSLDELPQLWNVLRGDMSLVGPRPPLPEEVQWYRQSDLRRLTVKPGITCLWQISGRNHVDFDDWMKLDLNYIDNWSYLTDIKILIFTIPAIFKQRGAY